MGVYKHGCDITRILIGDFRVLPDARHCFDCLVGNMSVHQENLIQSRSTKNPKFSFICGITLEKSFIKAMEDFFCVYIIAGMAQW